MIESTNWLLVNQNLVKMSREILRTEDYVSENA